jgi:F-type H+-transporting ATPase subunit gamma
MQWFTDGRYDAIDVAYMRFVSNSKQVPTIDRLLPLEPTELADPSEESSHDTQYDFSPEPQALLDELLPLTVKTRLFQFFNEAVVSEQIARMVAMKAATDNAEDMGRRLRRQFNRARQTQITTELNEVVSGAEALA